MKITINQSELHDAIFQYYETMDDLPPHPLPDTPDDLEEIMMILDGVDPVVDSVDSDNRILSLTYTPREWKNQHILRAKQSAGGKKAAKNLTKKQRKERAKKAAAARWQS